jgi:hypothetical protein
MTMIRLQVLPEADGLRVREQPVNGKPIGQIHVNEDIESLEPVEETRGKVGIDGQWLRVRTANGVEGYTAGWLLRLAPGQTLPEPEALEPPEPETVEDEGKSESDENRVLISPTIDVLRLRAAPEDGEQIALLDDDDILYSLEDEKSTLAKLGVMDEWLHVETLHGTTGHTAAWFLERYTGEIPEAQAPPQARSLLGVNLDIDHPYGKPAASELGEMGWVRVKFNVSFDPRKSGDARYGNTDVDYTYARSIDAIDDYVNAGYKVLMVLTHQTFGEGAGYHWPTMTSDRWRDLTEKYATMAAKVAGKFAGTGKIAAYQIWNEQDTAPEHARAAVPIPAEDYAHLLAATIKAIRAIDPDALVLTGGHVGGPDAGSDYARRTLAAMPDDLRPDGIAFHPYGRGPKGSPYAHFGPITESVRKYGKVLPGKPVWISEWGVLNVQGRDDLAGDIAEYARQFLGTLNDQFPGQVAAAIWYAWADGMDNGYGFTDFEGHPKAGLYERIVKV